MSVLIKDMVMPETCEDCPFHVYHSHYEYVCKATPMFYPMNLANTKGIRKEWCPLSEVPSAQQERRLEGKWIWELDEGDPDRSMMLVCSICGSGRVKVGEYNFCPTCGAKMINPKGE